MGSPEASEMQGRQADRTLLYFRRRPSHVVLSSIRTSCATDGIVRVKFCPSSSGHKRRDPRQLYGRTTLIARCASPQVASHVTSRLGVGELTTYVHTLSVTWYGCAACGGPRLESRASTRMQCRPIVPSTGATSPATPAPHPRLNNADSCPVIRLGLQRSSITTT